MAEKGIQSDVIINELQINSLGHMLGKPRRCGVVTGSDTWSVLASKFGHALWEDLDTRIPGPNGERLQVGELASLMNDIWVSGMLSRKHVPKYVIPCSYQVWDVIDDSAQDSVGLGTAVGHSSSFASRDAKNAEVMHFFRFDWTREEIRENTDPIR